MRHEGRVCCVPTCFCDACFVVLCVLAQPAAKQVRRCVSTEYRRSASGTGTSDGQSCFPAGLRGPVFLGFSLALINSGVPPLPPCPFGPCPTPPLPREPGHCILRPFPPPATLGVPPEAGLWNLRVCPSSLRLCGALRTLDSGFCASNSGALCWRPSGLRTVDSGWVAEGMARSPDSGFWIV